MAKVFDMNMVVETRTSVAMMMETSESFRRHWERSIGKCIFLHEDVYLYTCVGFDTFWIVKHPSSLSELRNWFVSQCDD